MAQTTRSTESSRERHGVQVGLVEGAAGHLLAGAREHLGRRVHPDHRVAERRQVGRVAAGAAGGVERDADGQAVEDLAHDRLLELEQLVARLVVGRRPAVVALARRDRPRLDSVAQLVGAIEQLADLGEAGDRERAVVVPGEGAQQRESLESEQVGQRVLVDGRRRHGCELTAGGGARYPRTRVTAPVARIEADDAPVLVVGDEHRALRLDGDVERCEAERERARLAAGHLPERAFSGSVIQKSPSGSKATRSADRQTWRAGLARRTEPGSPVPAMASITFVARSMRRTLATSAARRCRPDRRRCRAATTALAASAGPPLPVEPSTPVPA